MSDNSLIDSKQFEKQITQLLERHKALKHENAELKRQIADYKKEILELEMKIASLNDDYTRLKMARMFGWSEESKRQADDRLSRLVREIDRCLSLLK